MVRLRIKEVAKEKGISMGKLSRTSDVSYNTIKKIYTDPCYAINIVTLEKLANALGVPIVELIEQISD